ncbi:hypothetical protein M426DRAFT_262419 [Hypoxylon sp. CI-4A]|nr:hypothetical protein M426DRAFT_262419 [Hypoxylon sp. CI-4A]
MDPYAAIGLVGNIITFLDFGYKLISAAKDIHASTSGSGAYNSDLLFDAQHLQQLAASLNLAKPDGSLSKQERSLLDVANRCKGVSVELETLLDRLKAKDTKSKRQAFRAAIRDWRKKDEKNELESKLDRCTRELNLELLNLSRSETKERLDKIIKHGQTTSNELLSLTRSVESLRLGSNVSCLSSEALNQLRSLLQLTDDAVSKVRHARILDALRFDNMDERLDDIPVAHEKTFDWIFSSASDGDDKDTTSDDKNDDDDDDDDDDESLKFRDDNSVVEDRVNSVEPSSARPSIDDTYPNDNDGDGIDNSYTAPSATGDELNDDSSFEWVVDESEVEDERTSLSSDSDTSIEPEKSSVHYRASNVNDDSISLPLQPTMIEARDKFVTWLERGSGIFHISGKPGSGKSTLMKYLVRHPKARAYLETWAGRRKLVLGSFFFWKPGSALQKSIKGLVRSLLYCLLSECPDLIPVAFPTQWEKSTYAERVHIENHEFQSAFEKVISAGRIYSKHKLVLFIDGLDEFETTHAGIHADLVRQLLAWVNSETQNVKLCVSSREWAVFQDAFREYPSLRLHDLTRLDIQRYAQDRFHEMSFNLKLNNSFYDDSAKGHDISRLKAMVVDRSEGVFLWVALVLRHIEEGLVSGDQMQDFIELVQCLPTELERMFQQLLDSINPHHLKLAYSMLSFANFCNQYGSQTFLMQYSFLEEYIRDKDFAIDSATSLLTARANDERLERTKMRLYGVCRGLLELRRPKIPKKSSKFAKVLGNAVRFIHRSVPEFLESRDFKTKLGLELSDFDIFDAYCQTYIGLLKRVRLPTSYFVYRPKGNLSSLSYAPNWEPFNSVARVSLIYYPPHPSFRQDLELRISRHVLLNGEEVPSRFYEFLDNAYQIALDLAKLRPEIKHCHSDTYYNLAKCSAIDISLEKTVLLACATFCFYEYLLLKLYIVSENMALYVDVCIYQLGSSQVRTSRIRKTLQILFDHGASPDNNLFNTPVSHFHIYTWCSLWEHSAVLSNVAWMLYYGLNPRFSIVLSKKKYLYKGGIHHKAYFRSESPESQQGNGVEAVHMARKVRFAFPEIAVSSIVKQYGHTITLSALVSIWSLTHCDVLQEVIEWILRLGVPVDAMHRARLQAKFGPRLRPLFDQDHPSFIGEEGREVHWPGTVLDIISPKGAAEFRRCED